MTIKTEQTQGDSPQTGALYRAVWRWHLYAGLFVAPFAIFLAITGAIYLWKPQFEEWRYRTLFNVPIQAANVSPDAQLAAARAAYPSWFAQQLTPSLHPGRTTDIVMIDPTGAKHSVFVDPHTGQVVGEMADKSRFMATLHDLHDSLLLGKGNVGEVFIEVAASWAVVLLVTGFYLWWPRPFTVRGFLLPRLGAGRRALLRDLHAVPAVWLSGLTLILISTGLPWSSINGKWLKTVGQAIGEWQPRESAASAHRSELLGGWSPFLKDKALAAKVANVASEPAPAEDEHAMHRGHVPPPVATPIDPAHPPISLARVMDIAREHQVNYAYYIVLPQGPRGVYSILTDSNLAFTATFIHLDQYSGKVLADVRYKDFGLLAKFFAVGKSLHMGTLFGLPNQIVGLVAALGVMLLASTGVAMWWSRRPAGRLAALTKLPTFSLPKGAVVIVVVLAAILPLMAATLVFFFVLDRTVLRRLPLLRLA